MEETRRWVELVRVRDPALVGVLQSVLDAAEIEHEVEGEQVQGLFPVTMPGFFLDRGLGAVIRVRPEDLDDARRLLEEEVGELEEGEAPPDGEPGGG